MDKKEQKGQKRGTPVKKLPQEILHVSRKILTESEHAIKFVKYLAEVVNFDPFDDTTDLKLEKKGPDLYFFIKWG